MDEQVAGQRPNIVYNITINNYGTMTGSPIGSAQVGEQNRIEIEAKIQGLKEWISEFRSFLSAEDLPADIVAQGLSDADTAESLLESPSPRWTILDAVLDSAAQLLMAVAQNAAAQVLIMKLQELGPIPG